jgi:hypothetical protein
MELLNQIQDLDETGADENGKNNYLHLFFKEKLRLIKNMSTSCGKFNRK